jgi:hypothetical protein
MQDEADSQQPVAAEDGTTESPTPKARLPLIDDEYPMLIDQDEQG